MPSPQVDNYTDRQLADFVRLHEKLQFELAGTVRNYLGRLPQSLILGALAHIEMATKASMAKDNEEAHAREDKQGDN